MNWFTNFYVYLSFFIPIFGIIATVIFLYILNKIAKELKRRNDKIDNQRNS
jgi:hypothetical protein